MKALLPLTAIVVVSCGGKVTFDGLPGAGGAASTSSSSSSSAVVGSGVVGSAVVSSAVVGSSSSGGSKCDELASDYAAALAAAQACNTCNDSGQCGAVTAAPICGCPVPLNGENQDAINAAQQAFKDFEQAGCETPCPPTNCPITPGGDSAICSGDGKSCSGSCAFIFGD